MLIMIGVSVLLVLLAIIFIKSNPKAMAFAKTAWGWMSFILCVGLGAALVIIPQRGGDRITLHEGRNEDSGAILERINEYCYTRRADERTCRLYLKEFADYAYHDQSVFLTARQKINEKLSQNTDQSGQGQPTPGAGNYRASVDPQLNHHGLPAYGQIARTLGGLAKVIDSNAQAAAIQQQGGGM
jgi:hypothetical protein